MGEITIANVFTEVASVATGLVDIGLSFATTMWGNPLGKISLLTGLAFSGIGIAKRIFGK